MNPKDIITSLSVLKAKNEDVEITEAWEIIKELEAALAASKEPGIGLAAPQIGINKRVAIVRINTKKLKVSLDLINPVILDKEQGFLNKGEGCLSIPGKRINVRRYKEVFIKDDTNPAGVVATGITAVACQHEIDHLDGILITDRVTGKQKVGRNDPCPCGKTKNGKPVKYKKCHGK